MLQGTLWIFPKGNTLILTQAYLLPIRNWCHYSWRQLENPWRRHLQPCDYFWPHDSVISYADFFFNYYNNLCLYPIQNVKILRYDVIEYLIRSSMSSRMLRSSHKNKTSISYVFHMLGGVMLVTLCDKSLISSKMITLHSLPWICRHFAGYRCRNSRLKISFPK